MKQKTNNALPFLAIAALILLSIMLIYLSAIDPESFSSCADCREESETPLRMKSCTVLLIPNFLLLLYTVWLRIYRASKYLVGLVFGLFGVLLTLLTISSAINMMQSQKSDLNSIFIQIFILANAFFFLSSAGNIVRRFSSKTFLLISTAIPALMNFAFFLYFFLKDIKNVLPLSVYSVLSCFGTDFAPLGYTLFCVSMMLLGLKINAWESSQSTNKYPADAH